MVLVFACASLAKPVGVWTDQGMWDLAKSRLTTVRRKGKERAGEGERGGEARGGRERGTVDRPSNVGHR